MEGENKIEVTNLSADECRTSLPKTNTKLGHNDNLHLDKEDLGQIAVYLLARTPKNASRPPYPDYLEKDTQAQFEQEVRQ